jgi:hypothetical protein
MNCSDRDQNILLYEHGALYGWQRLAVAWHLSRCPRCQERREHLAAVSHLMAGAVREYDMPSPAFPRLTVARAEATGRMRPAPAARPAFVLTVVGMAMAVAACAMVYKATALAMPIDADKVPPHVTYIYRSAPRPQHQAPPSLRSHPAPAPSPCAPPSAPSSVPSSVPVPRPRLLPQQHRSSAVPPRPASCPASAAAAAAVAAAAPLPSSDVFAVRGRRFSAACPNRTEDVVVTGVVPVAAPVLSCR